MKATYNGITGELVKLEKLEQKKITTVSVSNYATHTLAFCESRESTKPQPEPEPGFLYYLIIYEPEKKATVHFENVNLADVKFSGGEVSFSG